MKGVYQRGNVWWVRYRFNGQLIRKAIGYDTRLAEEALKLTDPQKISDLMTKAKK